MVSRNAIVTLALAVAVLGAVLLSIGGYYLGVAMVEMDPGNPNNYANQVQADDPHAQAAQREEQAQAATIGWALLTGGAGLGVGALALGLFAPRD